jgi:crotonobetainyl-CoA:carnitine CoA-transferase CaiB-like acyl-CoA transferase
MPLALEGVRVLDLTWIIAGSQCSKLLADQGAEVIKLESTRSMDPVRQGGPWLNGVNTQPDGGGYFTLHNRNKLGATLDLQSDEGRALFLRLVAISDVVVNNYSAGTLERMGLGYDVLREANPGIIAAELSGMGQTGPYARHVAFGHTLLALSGAYDLTGFPDGPPFMPGYTLADFAGATIGALAICAALHHRRKTGAGQYLDLGQLQIAALLTGEEQLEWLVNGQVARRAGNSEPGALLHGCFACAGDDEWCVIAVWTDDEWHALAKALGGPPALRVQGALDRLRQRDEVERTVEAWTRQRPASEVMETLQAAGVEAAMVQTNRDLLEDDAHMAARGFYEQVPHLLGGTHPLEGIPFKMSETPAHLRSAGPVYGGDNNYVFGELLGLDAGEIQRLRESGVIP